MDEGGAKQGSLDFFEGVILLLFPLVWLVGLGQLFERMIDFRGIGDKISVIIHKTEETLLLLLVPWNAIH